MVLGLYYMTKHLKSTNKVKVKGEGLVFYSHEEVNIAYNEKKVDLNAGIKIRAKVYNKSNNLVNKIIDTTVGRVYLIKLFLKKQALLMMF